MDSLSELGDQLVVEIFVRDLDRSLAIYTALGFTVGRRDGNFAALSWEGREFFLDQRSDLAPARGPARSNVRILVRDVDAVWAHVQRLGLRVEQPIEDRYYGLRDFTVVDLDGFGLRFAGPLSHPLSSGLPESLLSNHEYLSAPPGIRPATSADFAAIGRLGELLVRNHHDFDPERFLPVTSGTTQVYDSFGTKLDEPNTIILVAERDGEVIGFTYAGLEETDYMALRGPAGALYDIVVDPAHRGQGIGRILLDATLEKLKALGAPRIVLSTAEKNVAAQRLFEGAGFRRTMIEMTRELKD